MKQVNNTVPRPEANGAEPETDATLLPARAGLDVFMERAAAEGQYAVGRMTVLGIKKARTSLRRARTVAEVFEVLDPDPAWRAMRKSGRSLFRDLGTLRDLHVMRTWCKRLQPPGDDVGPAYLRLLAHHERKERVRVRAALGSFDWQRWETWRLHLVPKVNASPLRELLFSQAAFERYTLAIALHRRCQRDAPAHVWHDLRKALKRFRYTLEIFMPDVYKPMRSEVKALQKTLGDLNDIDVFGERLHAIMPLFPVSSRRVWSALLRRERNARIEAYRELAEAETPLWPRWRKYLADEDTCYTAAASRWHQRYRPSVEPETGAVHLARVLLRIFSGRHAFRRLDATRVLRLLLAAHALLTLGKSARSTERKILTLAPPAPFTQRDLEEISLIVRFTLGRAPRRDEDRLQPLQRAMRERVEAAAALLKAALFCHRLYDDQPEKERPAEAELAADLEEIVLREHAKALRPLQRLLELEPAPQGPRDGDKRDGDERGHSEQLASTKE